MHLKVMVCRLGTYFLTNERIYGVIKFLITRLELSGNLISFPERENKASI